VRESIESVEAMKEKITRNMPLIIGIIMIVVLLILPTGYEGAVIYRGTDRCSALVLETDESRVISSGLIRSGEQTCTIRLLGGKFKGREVEGYNLLSGALESDKIFNIGDKAQVVINYREDEILSVNMIDHYRIDKELILVGISCIFLILFAGKKGIMSILSFVIAVLMIWKVMIPYTLNGYNPIFIGLAVVIILSFIIIMFVFGLDRRCMAAVLGSLLGIITTCLLGCIFTDLFKIHGAVMSYSESLLYAGFEHLNLTQIFMSSIFIGASGAVMDIAVDITSAIYEVVQKKPEIGWKEATMSGIHVGQAALGTMTTTLLLAYSGGYLALLMVFMAQGTPIYNILNYKYVSAEILDTIVGSIGLVTVAPFTALASGLLLTKCKKDFT